MPADGFKYPLGGDGYAGEYIVWFVMFLLFEIIVGMDMVYHFIFRK